MIREIRTIKDATEEWVSRMNAFPHGMIKELVHNDIDSWYEVTAPTSGDRVWVNGYKLRENCGVIFDYNEDTEIYHILLDDDTQVYCAKDDFEVDRDSFLPMWGTLWNFGNFCDDYWLEDEDGIRKMSECGFRIYHHEEWGYFFGIDGAGYDFYSEHWIPLYKARGLQWHDTEAI